MRRASLAALLFLCACGARSDEHASQLRSAAMRELKHGDLGQALTLTERALELETSESNPVEQADLRLLRGEILLLLRQRDKATPVVNEALPATAPFAALRAKQQCLKGHLQVLDNRLDEARVTLAQAEKLADAAGDPHVAFSARGLRGQALLRLQRWDEGEEALAELAADAERVGDDYHHAIALINLGMSRRVRDRFDAAVPYFEQAASLQGVPPRLRALALTNAGVSYSRLGDYDRAIGMQARAVEVHKASAPVFLVQALGELGTSYYLKGDTKQAIENLKRALEVASEAKLSRDAELWAAHLAVVYTQLGMWDEAERFNRQSRELNTTDDTARLVYNTLYDADIAAGRGDRVRAAEFYEEALRSDSTDPFIKSDAHAGLARIAVADGKMRQASKEFESALEIIERTQTGLLKTDYKLTYLTRLSSVYDQYVDALVSQRQFDRALEIADSSRARVLAERHGVSADRRHSAAEFK
ncbi:MAG: tetratricopeptide repeat protein, partial [Vicinamibacterales bacterium]